MATPQFKFTSTQVAALPAGKHSDGGGLYIYKLKSGSAQWVFRFRWNKARQEMGLGGYRLSEKERRNGLTLSEARKAADHHRDILASGRNPKEVRDAGRKLALDDAKAASNEDKEAKLLRTIVAAAFDAKKATLKGDGKAGRWISPLQTHILPKMGSMNVSDIHGPDIAKVLKPIWHLKPEVARKAANRLGQCLKYAKALGYTIDRDATDDARDILGKQSHKAKHIEFVAWQDVPAFYASLDHSVTHLALRLLILSGVRSKPVRFAHVDQFRGDVWTIPADLMKGKKGMTDNFEVPITPEIAKVIELASITARDGFLFPGVRKGVISDMSMSQIMKRRKMDARPHGFRTSFRVWSNNYGGVSFEAKEMVLSHKVGSTVTQSYNRDAFMSERRFLMEHWGAFVSGQTTIEDQNNVTRIDEYSERKGRSG